MATGPKIQYEIAATATGAAEVEKLATELEKLDDAVDPALALKAREAARALREIGQQQEAIDAFVRWKTATGEASAELDRAQAAAQKLGAEIAQSGGPTRAQAGQMQKLADAVREAKQELTTQTAGLDASRSALQQQGIPLDGVAAKQRALRQSTEQLRQELEGIARTASDANSFGTLVRDTDAARARMEALTRAADLYAGGLNKSGPPTAAQASNLRTMQQAADSARAAFEQLQAETGQQAAALRQAGANTERLTSQARELAGAQRQAGAAAQQFGAQSSAAAGQAVRANDGVRESVERIGGGLRNVAAAAAAVVGGGLLAGTVGDVLRTADAYSNLAARIKIATGEGAAFDTAFQGVFDVATRTSSAVESTGTLFTQITRAGKELGISQRDALSLTETINQAVQVSGASAASSDAALQQLIQGLQSGVLRGDEFNSVLEQAPRLAVALADGLGLTTSELREQANAGALSSQVVIKALQGQAAVVAGEFNQLPPTVGRALTNLSNEWTRYVGEVDKANGINSTAVGIINSLAGNLDTLGAVLFSAGKAAAAYAAVRLAATFFENAQAAAAAAAAKAQETAATVANTAAQGVNTAATAANTAAHRANAGGLGQVGSAAEGAAGGVGRLAGLMSTLKLLSFVGLVTNLQEIGTWIGESIAKWQGYGKAIEEAESKAKALEQAQREMAAQDVLIAQARQKAADATLGLNTQSQALIGHFEGVRKEGGTVADALAKVAKEAQLSDLTGIRNMSAALDALAQRGKISGEQVRAALADALKTEDLARFEAQARAAFDGSEQGARRLGAALAAIDTEALRRAGTSAEQISTGFNAASISAINDVDALAAAVDRLGVRNAETGRAMSGALDKALEAAGTEQAVQAVIDRMQALGQQGYLSGDQLSEGLDKARAKLDEIKPGVNSLNEALGTFGLKSREELQATADKMAESWEKISTSTQVSVADKTRAFEAYKAAATAANDGIVPSQLQVQEGMLRIQQATQAARGGMQSLGATGAAEMQRITAEARTAFNVIGQIGDRGQIDGKTVTGDTREQRLAGQNVVDAGGYLAVQQKLQNGTLTEADRPLVLALAAAAKQNAELNASVMKLSAGAISFQAQRSVADQQAVAERALASLAGQGAAPGQVAGFGASLRQTAEQAQAAAQAAAPLKQADKVQESSPSKTVLVRFDLGNGRIEEANAADQKSADVILSVLEQAARAMGR